MMGQSSALGELQFFLGIADMFHIMLHTLFPTFSSLKNHGAPSSVYLKTGLREDSCQVDATAIRSNVPGLGAGKLQ